ncbi:MAG: hypothetical protein L0Y54_18800, partial [Sporichthyaceae bacterium]|nr:hypothetical protein [Sporichthyaceae bacterium]
CAALGWTLVDRLGSTEALGQIARERLRFGELDPGNRALLARARGAVPFGGRLLVVDFFLGGDPDSAKRPLDALMAGEYLVVDGTAVYPEAEVRAWVEATGWRWRETRPLPGGPKVLLAEAV